MLILIKWYLLNVAFSMTKALVKVLPNKIFILPTSLPFLVEKPYFSLCVLSSFSLSLFNLKLYKISTDLTQCMFQINGNKLDQTLIYNHK